MKASKDYQKVIETIHKDRCRNKSYTVVVGGADHAGKTTLARYIAWQLRMSIFETDIYINPGEHPKEGDIDVLRSYINARHQASIPVIIEGICILETLERLSIEADFYILVENSAFKHGTGFFRERLEIYNEKYICQRTPDYKLSWTSK